MSWDLTSRRAPSAHRHLAGFMALALTAVTVTPAVAALGRMGGELVSVIVREDAGAGNAPERAVQILGGEVRQQLGIINGFSATVPQDALTRLESVGGVHSVTRNGKVRMSHAVDGFDGETDAGSMYHTNWALGSRNYWAKGFTGKGVDVALIDTGVSPVPGLDASGKLMHGPDISFESQDPNVRYLDTYGHGTHMAGIIAGRDAAAGSGTGGLSQDHDNFIGVAPDARVVSVKVANAMGATDVSQVIAAIDWVVQNKNANGLNIRVLNLSFGTDGTQDYVLDPLAYAAEVAWHKGIVVVVAAGNAGFGSAKLNNPAYDPYVIAVGADNTVGTTKLSDDAIPTFSSTGDTKRNPDLVAPGKSIVSLRVPGSQLDRAHPEGRINSRYFRGSGTSQAAAAVSGAAALVIQQRPSITPDQLKHLLMSTASPLVNTDPVAQGRGLVNLAKALDTATNLLAAQTWVKATGTGSLELSRGSLHVVDINGVELRGEMDIFGATFDSSLWAPVCLAGNTWSGGTWNGNTWSGNTWSGNTWSGNTWSGNTWSGNTWSGNTWSGNTWSGNTWSGNTWSGNTWSGNTWSGNTWSGNTWSGSGWLGISWGR